MVKINFQDIFTFLLALSVLIIVILSLRKFLNDRKLKEDLWLINYTDLSDVDDDSCDCGHLTNNDGYKRRSNIPPPPNVVDHFRQSFLLN